MRPIVAYFNLVMLCPIVGWELYPQGMAKVY
jgi:hypothetical protein